jgi:serine/threonine protein kinase
MKFSTVSKGLQAALLREASVMSKMANASVVRLYDSFQDDIFLYLVMEYSPLGDLEGYIDHKKGKFELSEISHIVRELSNGLRFLRSQSIVHRDLKPANILLFNKNPSTIDSREIPIRHGDLALKLTDFTMARRLDDGELAKTVCGSPLYMAPEVLNRRQYTDKADLWSIGVILYRLIFNTMPFNGLNELDLRDNLNHKPVPIPEGDPRLTPALSDLLAGLLQKDPFLRIDWEEFFIHPFLRPPRLGSTMMTDESIDAGSSSFGETTFTSDLTSISAQDAIDLQRQIRDYESRLQQAQKQVQQLIGDLEQSKLRELLRDQQTQRQYGAIPSQSSQPASNGIIGFGPSAPSNGLPNADPRTGTIRFSAPAGIQMHPNSISPPSSTSSSSNNPNSQVQPLNSDITELAISTLSEKLLRLSGSANLSHSGMQQQTTTTTTSLYDNPPTKVTKSNGFIHTEEHPLKSNSSSRSSVSSNGTGGGNGSGNGSTHTPTSSNPSPSKQEIGNPEMVAAQSNIQLLLSQIHPDRAIAIDIVQHLLAEVLVSSDEDLSRSNNMNASLLPLNGGGSGSGIVNGSVNGNGASDMMGQNGGVGVVSSSSVPFMASSSSSTAVPHSLPMMSKQSSSISPIVSPHNQPIHRQPEAAPSRPNVSSSKPLPAGAKQPLQQQQQQQRLAIHPYGMTPEQAEAWDLERATIVAEGEQWRQLFSQASNDYESMNGQLSEAKTMVEVLQDDLKDKSDRLANFVRLEQEYTRSTIYLEDQLKSSKERVSYLEAEFQALDAYRSQMRRN